MKPYIRIAQTYCTTTIFHMKLQPCLALKQVIINMSSHNEGMTYISQPLRNVQFLSLTGIILKDAQTMCLCTFFQDKLVASGRTQTSLRVIDSTGNFRLQRLKNDWNLSLIGQLYGGSPEGHCDDANLHPSLFCQTPLSRYREQSGSRGYDKQVCLQVPSLVTPELLKA